MSDYPPPPPPPPGQGGGGGYPPPGGYGGPGGPGGYGGDPGGYGGGPGGYGGAPGYGGGAGGYGPPPTQSNTLSIIGIVCGVISLLFCPILFGPAGLILGGVGMSRKERLAPWALGVSAVGLVGGLVLGFLVFSNGVTVP